MLITEIIEDDNTRKYLETQKFLTQIFNTNQFLPYSTRLVA